MADHERGSTTPTFCQTGRSLPIALLRAREAVMGPVRDMLAGSPVNEQKWRVLRVLDERGPLDQNSIARAACLLLPSLTRILRAMEAEKLISRVSDPDDRRRSIAHIEPGGRAVLEAHADEATDLINQLRTALGAEKYEQLLDLLEELERLRPELKG